MAKVKKTPAGETPSKPAPILPRKEPVQERSRARFERILDVFRDLTISKGLDTVSMKDVARDAGISIASLYQYFPDKAALVATLADRFNKEGEEYVSQIMVRMTSVSDVEPVLIAILECYYDFFRNVPGSYAIWQASQADIRLHRLDEEHCEAVTRIIAKGFKLVFPQFKPKEAHHHACLVTVIIASVVRKVATLPTREAKGLLRVYESQHLPSMINALKAGH